MAHIKNTNHLMGLMKVPSILIGVFMVTIHLLTGLSYRALLLTCGFQKPLVSL